MSLIYESDIKYYGYDVDKNEQGEFYQGFSPCMNSIYLGGNFILRLLLLNSSQLAFFWAMAKNVKIYDSLGNVINRIGGIETDLNSEITRLIIKLIKRPSGTSAFKYMQQISKVLDYMCENPEVLLRVLGVTKAGV